MDNLGQLQLRKAFEISYAVLRLAADIGNRPFRSFFDEYSLRLLDAVIRGDRKTSEETVLGLDYFIKLAFEIGLINQNSALVVVQELSNLNTAISENNAANDKSEELRQIFSRGLGSNKLQVNAFPRVDADFRSEAAGEAGQDIRQNSSEPTPSLKPAVPGNLPDNKLRVAGDRPSNIVDKIRQSGYCRLSDIQAILPDVSERTIRYDLERLSSQGIIERFGGGGPATYYRIKREVS